MKKGLLLTTLFLAFATFCSAQSHLPCDDSKMGMLIIKPLVKSGVVHYELAKKKGNNIVHNMVRIKTIDTIGDVFAERYFVWNRDSAVTLRYDYTKDSDLCVFQLFIYHQSGIAGIPWILEDEPYLLNGAGDYIGKIEDDAMAVYIQRRIDHLLGFFK